MYNFTPIDFIVIGYFNIIKKILQYIMYIFFRFFSIFLQYSGDFSPYAALEVLSVTFSLVSGVETGSVVGNVVASVVGSVSGSVVSS